MLSVNQALAKLLRSVEIHQIKNFPIEQNSAFSKDEHTSRDLIQPPRLTALFLMMVLKHHAFVWVGWFLNEI
jgi:hypothetical protein